MVGMIKKNVRNRMPVLRINWATFPHVPQRRDSAISSDPQKKTFVPMINIAAVRITRVGSYRHSYNAARPFNNNPGKYISQTAQEPTTGRVLSPMSSTRQIFALLKRERQVFLSFRRRVPQL